MNRLVIIGNGFDLAHGLKTNYTDFIEWLLNSYFEDIFVNNFICSRDDVFFLQIQMQSSFDPHTGERVIYGKDEYIQYKNDPKNKSWDFLLELKNKVNNIDVIISAFLSTSLKNIENKGWTDIENDYYSLLKVYSKNNEMCKQLNAQLQFIQDKLIEYLSNQRVQSKKDKIQEILLESIDPNDISTYGTQKINNTNLVQSEDYDWLMIDHHINPDNWKPESIMLLSFNYTNTIGLYHTNSIIENYIHGNLNEKTNIIFGYGDELDKSQDSLLDLNDNELLKYSKSIKYLETGHYRQLLAFIESNFFQVYIMGHSCGNSDRTLLNTIFEHKNCISIKPFYYIQEDGTDTYLELTMNIYRNFKDKTLFRDRVVNKEFCTTLTGKKA